MDKVLRSDDRPGWGETGLHWAAYGGHAETVRTLIARGMPIDAVDSRYGGTPLGWALYGWQEVADRDAEHRNYSGVVSELVRAGARLDRDWYAQDEDRRRALAKAEADSRMNAALRGELTDDTAVP